MTLSTLQSEHGTLPIAPLDRPPSWFARLLLSAMRKRYGKTPTAFRVLYSRAPFLGFLSLVIYLGLARFLRISDELCMLLQHAVAMQNGCTFCMDLQLAELARQKLGHERFRDLAAFDSSPTFTAAEKAALAYARALNESLHIPDSVWAELRRHFDERQCIDIVWVCAVERYYNSIALPLRIGSDGLAAS